MAPKPIRLTVRSPPMLTVPADPALGVALMRDPLCQAAEASPTHSARAGRSLARTLASPDTCQPVRLADRASNRPLSYPKTPAQPANCPVPTAAEGTPRRWNAQDKGA